MSNDDQSDAVLLAATGRGDGTAFGVLVRRYIRPATLLAAQLLGDRDDADDVVQDAFTVVHRNAGTFDAERPFGPWLFGIVHRLAANKRTRDLRRSRLLQLWSRTSDVESSPSPEASVLDQLEAAAARGVIERLSPMQRACFELVVLRGLSNEEVAAMHGITESTVRQHVFRARAALRIALGGEGGE